MSLQKHHDSDSTPSDDEKKITGVGEGDFETLGHGELPPDPDAGLSAAEKAAIVSISALTMVKTSAKHRTGQEATMEARSSSHPLALPSLPYLLP